eukprot:29508-Pelagococcus_subviridis.AAC.5
MYSTMCSIQNAEMSAATTPPSNATWYMMTVMLHVASLSSPCGYIFCNVSSSSSSCVGEAIGQLNVLPVKR